MHAKNPPNSLLYLNMVNNKTLIQSSHVQIKSVKIEIAPTKWWVTSDEIDITPPK